MSPKTVQKPIKSVKRPPVVVVMGHIDHGKSTLLDYIRKTNITAGEAGGITQHLGAYEVIHSNTDIRNDKNIDINDDRNKNQNKITFLDTPGHEAFCAIRERGAHVADIAILVVSAEDGVKPQTIEALKCILAEKIPYIVAINKIDKDGASVERTKQRLAENEIYIEGYGGDIPVVPISALNGQGIKELLDMVMLIADMADLKADPDKLAMGSVIEAGLDNKKGIYAVLLIKNGTLKTGTYIVSENAYAPVRILEDFQGKPIKTALFSSPVRVTGFNKIPTVGASFISLDDKKIAEKKAESFKPPITTKTKSPTLKINDNNSDAEEYNKEIEEKTIITIPFIIKADAIGSLEGIKHELEKIKQKEKLGKVRIKIIGEGIGNVNEGDVKTAQSNPDIMILAFNAKPDSKAKSVLERSTVHLESFNIIYNVIEFVDKLVTSKIPKEYTDEVSGIAKIMAIFSKNKDKQIIGGKVQEGGLLVGSEVKILRRDIEIGRGKIKELQQKKIKASEVQEGYEFGALVESKMEIAIGDKLQGFRVVEKT